MHSSIVLHWSAPRSGDIQYSVNFLGQFVDVCCIRIGYRCVFGILNDEMNKRKQERMLLDDNLLMVYNIKNVC